MILQARVAKRGEPMKISMRPNSDEDNLNKTEKRFLDLLRSWPHAFLGIQCMTLKLGDDCRYTPDFVRLYEGGLVAYEVKGFWRDDARVKIKVAARTYPFIHFIAVQRKGSNWFYENIKP